MLVLVEDQGEAVRLAPWLKRAGYQVLFADTLPEAARWLGTRAGSRAVIGSCQTLAPDLFHALIGSRTLPDAPPANLETIAPGILFDVSRQAIRNGASVQPLTMTEARLLRALLDHPGRPLSRVQLLDLVWGFDYAGQSREVDVYVRYLRRKIEPEPTEPRFILTVRGLGYMLKRPDPPDGEL
ncbi:MAG TPA: winged helix-turn-helix domain-containing protein [Anaerolineae bacterium]|nr:winged helix-turn-helix domain-containing protein [Anaerolineae bacterium]